MKMKPLFICYPRCSTCQKALKWLQEREELIRVLSTDGMLVKRPLLIASDKILVGFREPEWAAALSEKR